MPNRIKTKYPGAYYRHAKRTGGSGTERVYYAVFKQDGRTVEEKVGCQYKDDMTAAKAARYRADRIEGRQQSRKEIRRTREAERQAEANRWTIGRLWEAYKGERTLTHQLKSEDYSFKKYLLPEFGDKMLSELVPLDVDRIRIRWLKEKSPRTVHYLIQLLVRLSNYAIKKQLCSGLNFVPEKPKVNNITTECLTDEQIARLLAVIEDDPHPIAGSIMKLALFTGMRRGEIFKLKWADVDFERSFITLRDPKGGKDQAIPLNDAAREVLQAQSRKSGSDYVFPSKDGGQLKDLKKQFNRIKEAAKLPTNFRHMHGLRHTYASMLASSGKVDLYTLQKLMTQKSPQMTQRYAHLRDETLRKGADLAGRLISDAVEQSKQSNEKGLGSA